MTKEDDIVVVSEEVINSDACIAKVKSDSAGGISVFMGTTRDMFEGTFIKS